MKKTHPRLSEKNPESQAREFAIRMGRPRMDALWGDLMAKFKGGRANAEEARLYKKWGKALALLSANPLHPGLRSHEISSLTRRYRRKVFESYLENRTPNSARMFWTYGPGRKEITILALEPHPERGEYERLKLDF